VLKNQAGLGTAASSAHRTVAKAGRRKVMEIKTTWARPKGKFTAQGKNLRGQENQEEIYQKEVRNQPMS